MKKDVMDVDYTEINDFTPIEYYTIDEVSKMLDVENHNIIFWCDKFRDILKIQSVGMYQIFDKNDVTNLKEIKRLNIDEKKSINEVKEYMKSNNRLIVSKKENNLDVSLVSVFTKILSMQNNKIDKLIESQTELITNIQKVQKEQKSKYKKYEKNILELKNKVDNINEIAVSLEEHIDLREQEAIKRDTEILDTLHKNLEERKKQHELELQQKKGFFYKLFKGK